MDAVSDQVLDGYRLIRFLGRGGFGEVWLCRSEAMGDYRALKIISTTSPEHLRKEYDSLLQYRNASAQLRTPHLLPIEHVNLVADGLFYVMPLADGIGASDPDDPAWTPLTLAQMIFLRMEQSTWFSSEEVIGIIQPILQALQTLSDAGLVHRDVKPENIMFFGGKPCLGDISLLGVDAHAITQRGTPGYVTPSWYVDGLPDMYGVAATLYHLLTGNAPDKMGRTAFLWPPKGEKSLTPPERSIWSHLHKVIRRACEEKPSERYLHFQAMADALTDVAGPNALNNRLSNTTKNRFTTYALSIATVVFVLLTSVVVYQHHFSQTAAEGEKQNKQHSASDQQTVIPEKVNDSVAPKPRTPRFIDMRGHFRSSRERVIAVLPYALATPRYTSDQLDQAFAARLEVKAISQAYVSRDYEKCLQLIEKRIVGNPEFCENTCFTLLKALVLKHLNQSQELENLMKIIETRPAIIDPSAIHAVVTFLEPLGYITYAERLINNTMNDLAKDSKTSERIELYHQRARCRILSGNHAGALADERAALELPPEGPTNNPTLKKQTYQRHLNTIVRNWELLEQEFPTYAAYLAANGYPDPMPDFTNYDAED